MQEDKVPRIVGHEDPSLMYCKHELLFVSRPAPVERARRDSIVPKGVQLGGNAQGNIVVKVETSHAGYATGRRSLPAGLLAAIRSSMIARCRR